MVDFLYKNSMPPVYYNNVTTTIYAQNLEKAKRKKKINLKEAMQYTQETVVSYIIVS